MKNNNFNLSDYTASIQNIAKEHECSVEQALGMFIANLATMKEHYAGSKDVDFRKVGQLWNSLSSSERIVQKKDTLMRLSRRSRGGNAE